MNYLLQLVGFRKRRMEEPIGMHAVLLYFILLEYANQIGFPESFTAANTMISALSGLTDLQLHRARENLAERGYIGYRKGSENRCGTYTIIDLFGAYNTRGEPQGGGVRASGP